MRVVETLVGEGNRGRGSRRSGWLWFGCALDSVAFHVFVVRFVSHKFIPENIRLRENQIIKL